MERMNFGTPDPEQFLREFRQGNLQVTPAPDILEGFRMFRHRISFALIFSLITALVPVCCEVVLAGNQSQLAIAQQFYRYSCGFSITLDVALIFYCLSSPTRWEIMTMVGELAHWKEVIDVFTRAKSNRVRINRD
jgi:hypothetical protein